MAKFEKIIETLEYHARCETATVMLGTKGIFGSTYSDAAETQARLNELNEAIELLKANQ